MVWVESVECGHPGFIGHAEKAQTVLRVRGFALRYVQLLPAAVIAGKREGAQHVFSRATDWVWSSYRFDGNGEEGFIRIDPVE